MLTIYSSNGVQNDLVPLPGAGHGVWGFEFDDETIPSDLSFDFDGTTLRDLSFAFITQQLDLIVVE